MRVLSTILICSAGLLAVSCGPLWPEEKDAPAPIAATTDAGPAGEAVAEAPAVLPSLTPGKEPPLLAPMTAADGGLSREVTPPAPTGPSYRRLDDGAEISRRSGRMVRADGGAWRFVFDRVEGEAAGLEPLEILPNAYLEQMERLVAERADERLIFHISGEVTRYRGRGYLMIGSAVVETAAPADGEDEPVSSGPRKAES